MLKTVLITGSSRGIGRAAALAFSAAGYQVVINSLSHTGLLASLRKEILSSGGNCLSVPGDVGDPAFVRRLFAQIRQEYGRLDVLVNNAAISHIGLVTDVSDEQWARMLQVNLSSVFYCCREAVPLFLANRDKGAFPKNGAILNVSSVWGCAGASCEAAYSATKGGVNAFTQALAKELAPSGIPVNAVAFGVIDTDMNRCLSDEERETLAEEIPAGRFASAAEAANALLMLAEADPYLTGQVVRFDGGFL